MLLNHDAILDRPKAAREALLQVLNWIARADDHVDVRERAFIDEVARRLGVEDAAANLSDAPEWQESWVSELAPTAHYVLLQCAWAALVDEVCDLRELEKLERLEDELDATPGTVSRALDWARAGQSWLRDGLAILAADEPEAAA